MFCITLINSTYIHACVKKYSILNSVGLIRGAKSQVYISQPDSRLHSAVAHNNILADHSHRLLNSNSRIYNRLQQNMHMIKQPAHNLRNGMLHLIALQRVPKFDLPAILCISMRHSWNNFVSIKTNLKC